MAYENIQFRKSNMSFVDGYFYMFDEDWDAVVQKTDDGDTAFTYPLNTTIVSAVQSLEYDGVNFWTMQDVSDGVSIKRWQLRDGVGYLEDTITCVSGAGHSYESDTFSVSNYNTTFDSPATSGTQTIVLSAYGSAVIVSGTVTIGPNASDQSEDVVVDSVASNTITIVSGTQYAYDVGDAVSFYDYIWLFNNYNGSNYTGAIYKIDAHSGVYITKYADSDYKDVTASTFAILTGAFSSATPSLAYVKSTNLKFLDVNDFSNIKVMTMDNLRSNQSTGIDIYDISISNNDIYRLQDEATYYGSDNDWGSSYNYQLSTARPFVDNITVGAYPVIVPSDGYTVLEVQAIVNNQYGQGIQGKPVYFTDDDTDSDGGYLTINPAYTDLYGTTGQAITYYRSGVTPKSVTIQGTATQDD